MKRRRRPKAGTVKQLTSVLWAAIQRLEDTLEATEAQDVSELCRVAHAMSQTSSTYLKALEVGELEARVEALEQSQQGYKRAA